VKRLLPTGIALAGVLALALFGGDPRGARDDVAAWHLFLVDATLALTVAVVAWAGGRRAPWLLLPSVFFALMGGLSGWIAACEILGHPDVAESAPGRSTFLIAMTAFWMAAPPTGLAWLADLRRRDRART
jgi:hypothetical protein